MASKKKHKIEIFAFKKTRSFTTKQLPNSIMTPCGAVIVIRGKKLTLDNGNISLLKDHKYSYIALVWTGKVYTMFQSGLSSEDDKTLINKMFFISSKIQERDIATVNNEYEAEITQLNCR
jgi:hypothetical protein